MSYGSPSIFLFVSCVSWLCSEAILWTAQSFETKLVIVVHYHEVECQTKNWVAIFKVKVTVRNMFLLYLLNLQFFVTKLSLVVDHQKRKVLCSENIGWLCSVSRSQEGFKFQLRYVLLYVWTISAELWPRQALFSLISLLCDIPTSFSGLILIGLFLFFFFFLKLVDWV